MFFSPVLCASLVVKFQGNSSLKWVFLSSPICGMSLEAELSGRSVCVCVCVCTRFLPSSLSLLALDFIILSVPLRLPSPFPRSKTPSFGITLGGGGGLKMANFQINCVKKFTLYVVYTLGSNCIFQRKD